MSSSPFHMFSEVDELVSVCWFEIRGWINTSLLSPNTLYVVYLVFKACASGTYGFEYQPCVATIVIPGGGGDPIERNVFLNAERGRRLRYQIFPRRRIGIFSRYLEPPPPPPVEQTESVNDLQKHPKERTYGWLEMELGEYFNEGGDDKEVEISVCEVRVVVGRVALFFKESK